MTMRDDASLPPQRRVVDQLMYAHRVSLLREGDMVKLTLAGHFPLTIERFANCLLLIGHSFDNNYKLIRNPEFTFKIDKNVWTPVSWRREDHLVEAADLDESDGIIQIDPVNAAMIWDESEKSAERLVEDGWLKRAVVSVATSLTQPVEN